MLTDELFLKCFIFSHILWICESELVWVLVYSPTNIWKKFIYRKILWYDKSYIITSENHIFPFCTLHYTSHTLTITSIYPIGYRQFSLYVQENKSYTFIIVVLGSPYECIDKQFHVIMVTNGLKYLVRL